MIRRARPPRAPSASDTALAADLRAAVRGEVRFDAGSRALYATDASNYRQTPIGVVIPRDVGDIVETVAVARRHRAPVVPRGGGTSLAGQCCNAAVVIDASQYVNRVLEIDQERRLARVEPGLVLDDLQRPAKRFALMFGPDPSTHNRCTLGGMIGNNSCGVHSLTAGRTSENVEELEILTYDGLRMRVGKTSDAELTRAIHEGGRRGEIYRRLRDLRDRYAELIRARLPKIPRRGSGYNLDELLPEHGFHLARALCGTEGTCVTVLEATLRLVERPPARALLVLGYPDVYQAADAVPEILSARPFALEGLDDRLVDNMKRRGLHPADLKLLPDGGGWLVVEFGGQTKPEADAQAQSLIETLERRGHAPAMRLFDDPHQEKLIWEIRESGLGATARVPGEPDTWEGWEDSAVAPERLGQYLRELRALLERHRYRCALYGHFGQGCVHTRIEFDLFTRDGIRKFRSFLDAAADLVLRLGGSLSGEHGDGQSRAELYPKMFGPELGTAFREFKAIWDPDGKMNPRKLVDAYRIDENLRLGTEYRPPQLPTHFQFPGDDHGSFSRATLRCVGIGECRRTEGGTMCPSYMVTREEKHSTRGRARLLFEMLQGETLADGWRDEHVKEALDLCLACKGCKRECPINVDMATYKAEFLSHYYEGRRRPVTAYAMGLIYWWSRIGSAIPRVANLLTQTPLLRDLAKATAGIAGGRRLPALAPETFVRWFRRRGGRNVGAPVVLLWPDTFNNHFHPETARAAVEVLEALGYRVTIPSRSLCCGRPLYDYGMLDTAKALLRDILDSLRPDIAAGIPVVGLEPSCVAVFRDELINLFPTDEDAKRLSRQTFLLSEFLESRPDVSRFSGAGRKAIVHGHCHHKAVMGFASTEALLKRLGLDATVLDSGCCGMAGSFGFEKDHYDLSMKAGERVLLPAVRAAARDALIIADGFSCREQIAHGTDRRALHLAEVMAMALRDGSDPAITGANDRRVNGRTLPRVVLAGGAALVFAGALAWSIGHRRAP